MKPDFFARFAPDRHKSTVTTVTGKVSDSSIRGNVSSPAVTPRALATVTTVTAPASVESVTPVTPPIFGTVTAGTLNSVLESQSVSVGVTPVTPVTPDFCNSGAIAYAADDWDSDQGPPILAAWRANIERRRRMGYSAAQAHRLAYGAALDDWHRQHGARVLPGCCAGCGGALRNGDNLHSLPDGARVHSAGHACLIAYGQKWRGAARTALSGAGINPPAGWSEI